MLFAKYIYQGSFGFEVPYACWLPEATDTNRQGPGQRNCDAKSFNECALQMKHSD